MRRDAPPHVDDFVGIVATEIHNFFLRERRIGAAKASLDVAIRALIENRAEVEDSEALDDLAVTLDQLSGRAIFYAALIRGERSIDTLALPQPRVEVA